MSDRNARIELFVGSDGNANAASAVLAVRAAPPKLWAAMRRFDGYAERIPMVEQIERRDAEVDLRLRFRLSMISARFAVRARVEEDPERELRFVYLSGEPRDADLRIRLEPAGEGASTLHVYSGFALDSLGWVVKYFLKHHPEIRAGVHAGAAFSIATALRDMAESS